MLHRNKIMFCLVSWKFERFLEGGLVSKTDVESPIHSFILWASHCAGCEGSTHERHRLNLKELQVTGRRQMRTMMIIQQSLKSRGQCNPCHPWWAPHPTLNPPPWNSPFVNVVITWRNHHHVTICKVFGHLRIHSVRKEITDPCPHRHSIRAVPSSVSEAALWFCLWALQKMNVPLLSLRLATTEFLRQLSWG